jgi:hypothetical protein
MSEPKRRKDITDEEIFGIAASYFSEAFPNPQRIGCPPDSELTSMVEHPHEAAHATVSEHLTCCSPCFNRYMELLDELKKRKNE